MNEYGLHCKFNPAKHKQTFTNYLEVIILPGGEIQYATPSHQEKLIHIMQNKYQITRDEVNKRCPPHMYFNFMQWLLDQTGCISVWNDFIMTPSPDTILPNEHQVESLELLKGFGLYKGEIPNVRSYISHI